MLLVGIAFGIAVVATLLLALHVWRRFPTMPARIPLNIRIDGPPGQPYPRAFVWLVPAIFAVIVAGVGASVLRRRHRRTAPCWRSSFSRSRSSPI